MRFFLLSFLIVLISCQPSDQFKNMFKFFKNDVLTQVAQEASRGSFSEEQTAQLLVLFLDLEATKNCSQVIKLLETNEFLESYGKSNKYIKGFLFDIFYGLNYDSIVLLGVNKNTKEGQLARVIASIWKTKFSIERINSVLADITYCYPYARTS